MTFPSSSANMVPLLQFVADGAESSVTMRSTSTIMITSATIPTSEHDGSGWLSSGSRCAVQISSAFSQLLNLHNLSEEISQAQHERAVRMGEVCNPRVLCQPSCCSIKDMGLLMTSCRSG